MTKLQKCTTCNEYTMKNVCTKCNKKTINAHNNYEKLPNAPKTNR